MSRPVIGITTYRETARWGVWNCPAVLVPADYVRQVSGAGAVPVLLPPLAGDVEVLDRLDGLVLAGGADVDPARLLHRPAVPRGEEVGRGPPDAPGGLLPVRREPDQRAAHSGVT